MRNPVWRKTPEGSRGYPGWGVVRDDITTRRVVWAPVPLHILFRYGERAWWRLAYRAGLKNRLDCPCCGQRFSRFRWTTEQEYIKRVNRLDLDLTRARTAIRQLRQERAQRPDPPKNPTPLRDQRLMMTRTVVARTLRQDADGIEELARGMGGKTPFADGLAHRLRRASHLVEDPDPDRGRLIYLAGERVRELETAITQWKRRAHDAMELYPETHICFPGEPLP